MNVLVLANMKPSKADPIRGIFVQNQVDALKRSDKVDQLLFLGIGSGNKSLAGLLQKYLHLLLSVFTQAIFSTKRFDVIHVHYYFPTIWYALVYKWLRNPQAKIVVTFHGSDVNGHQNPSWFYRVANRFVDHHIFVSAGLKDAYFTEPRAFSVLSAGILSCFEPEQALTSDKTFDLLVIGRLIPSKGIDRLLALMEALEGNLHVGVVGEGPLAQTIKEFQSDKHKLPHLG
ncbi:MAG: glycosyltransferase, partial [Psychrosphaera sp.]|nr:glycosyltransferase [Psychrosphaera sp.]